MTDKQIQKYFLRSKSPAPEGDKFMEDLIRQLDLLPQPAFDDDSRADEIAFRLERLNVARLAISKRIRISACSLGIISVSSISLLAMAVLLLFV